MPKPVAIDIHQSYPCPICHGKLQPIFLTDALGCNRCHFVGTASKDREQIKQVGAFDRTWYWNGEKWYPTKPMPVLVTLSGLTTFRVILLLGIVIVLCFLLKVPEIILGLVSTIFLALFLAWQFLIRNH